MMLLNRYLFSAVLGVAAAASVHAAPARKVPKAASGKAGVCKEISTILSGVPGSKVEKTEGRFEFGGVNFQGCSFIVEGKKSELINDAHPKDLLYPSEPDSKMFKDGWSSDIEVVSPNTSFFRIKKETAFCLVTASWDGGNDADPDYKPKDEYSLEVRCAEYKVK